MTTISKFTTPTAAGAEVSRRAERYMAEKGGTYQEAAHVILAADPELATAYAAPASWPRSVPDRPVRIPLPPGERLLW